MLQYYDILSRDRRHYLVNILNCLCTILRVVKQVQESHTFIVVIVVVFPFS